MSQRAFHDAETSTEVVAKDNEHSILTSHCRNTGVHHVGLHAKDPAASAAFYRDILGMKLVGGSGPEHPIGATAFLSSRPDEESHDIVLVSDERAVHTAFKVASLAEFRLLHARVVNRKVPVKFVFNHGTSFAFYFDDPDGNTIEVYWLTGAALDSYRQPYVEELDLTQSDEALLERVARGPASRS